ncbi:MAG TPA: HU family DNA-binding protein [Mycobacteriales bacterium]|nr:HU family DNA-binding protein [Mycobacteriales bacterium]
MNRQELVTDVASRSGLSADDVSRVITALQGSVTDAVSKGDKVTVPGFLTLERTHRAARTGRNPQTGEPIEIAAGYAVKVSAGATLRNAVKA